MKQLFTQILILTAFCLTAPATVIVYEPYPIGTNPSGYTAGESIASTNNVDVNATEGAWTGDTTGATSYVVTASGLSYSGLQTSGGAIQSSVVNVTQARPFAVSNITTATYYSFLVNFADFDSAAVLLNLADSSGNFVSGARFSSDSGGTLYVQSNGSVGSGTAVATNQTYLIVGKWTPGATDTTELWLNPVAGDPEPVTPTLSLSAGAGSGVAQWSSYIHSSGLSDYTFDEFRVGDTWASVTPVPEPGTLSLLALGALFALRQSRKFKRNIA